MQYVLGIKKLYCQLQPRFGSNISFVATDNLPFIAPTEL
jgi:hypothetical protein